MDPRLEALLADCEGQWDTMQEKGHPLRFVRETLQSTPAKTEFVRAAVALFKHVHPDFRTTCLQSISADAHGCFGEAHVLMLGFHKMVGINCPVFWKGEPAVERLRDVWRLALRGGRGTDTTARQLKVAVAPSYVDRDLSRELFFGGYVQGSTLGGASLLLLMMLINTKCDFLCIPEVRAFLVSICRLKCTFVVYSDAATRQMDAWRLLAG